MNADKNGYDEYSSDKSILKGYSGYSGGGFSGYSGYSGISGYSGYSGNFAYAASKYFSSSARTPAHSSMGHETRR